MPETEFVSVTARFRHKRANIQNSNFRVNYVEAEKSDNLPVQVIANGRTKNGYEFVVSGYDLPTVDALMYKYFGEWKNTKYGMQFSVRNFAPVTPDTKKGLIYYLCSPLFKGIGLKLATDIVCTFGDDTLNIIEKEPQRLLMIKGISPKKVSVITNGYKATEAYRKLAILLGGFEISSEKTSTVFHQLGYDSEEKVRNNPYILTNVRGIGFLTADRVARGLNVMLNSGDRIAAAVQFALHEDSATKGNLYTAASVLKKRAMNLLNDGFPQQVVSEEELDAVLRNMAEKKDIIVDGNAVFAVDNYIAEQEVASKLVNLAEKNVPAAEVAEIKVTLNAVAAMAKFTPSEQQKSAALMALTHNVSVITGGPGTGKTTITRLIIDTWKKVYGDKAPIVGMAPTGKAASRMSSSAGFECRTIHSTIGIYSDDMKTDQIQMLPENALIIIDEMSMIDQYVMQKLMAALPMSSRLVMVGDADQLPSVSAGEVLNQIIESGSIPVTQLTEIFRQGKDAEIIKDNAHVIRQGNTKIHVNNRFSLVKVDANDNELFDDGMPFIPNAEEVAFRKILKIYKEKVRQWGLDNVQILCPLRHNKTISVDNLNKALKQEINPDTAGSISASINGKKYSVLDKVIQIKNCDDASNGDVGTIERIRNVHDDSTGEDNPVFTISWDNGKTTEYSTDDMMNVDLGYCLTIHKSQGSEYKCVIMPFLSDQICPIFTKNMLYTGITRATEEVILLCDSFKPLVYCIKHSAKGERNTMLAKRLRDYEQRER